MRVLLLVAAISMLTSGLVLAQTDMTALKVNATNVSAKSPGSALLYSILVPGGGQLYNGETGKGLLQMGAAVVGVVLFISYLPSSDFVRDDYYWASYGYYTDEGSAVLSYGGLAVALGASVWSIIDAPKGARRYNERHGLVSMAVGGHSLWVDFDHPVKTKSPGVGVRLGLTL
ncbi:MAG: hypothetical protein AB1644_08755 [Candidatus Zixiibacteriota bacterium]